MPLIAIDTNVVVRVMTRDDVDQAEAAAELMRSSDLWIPKTVILETEWVLRYAYGFGRDQVNGALRKLVGMNNASIEDTSVVERALTWHGEGMDFADALHLASSARCEQFATFDQALMKVTQKLGCSPKAIVIE